MDFVTQPKRKSHKRITLAIVMLCSLAVVIVLSIIAFTSSRKESPHNKKQSFVPSSISQRVPFPIYYPDPNKLPSDYSFDRASFSTNGEVVVYSVSYKHDKKIAFTLQKKPSSNELDSFYSKQIPLRTEIKTDLGTAAVSSINNQRFLSFPIGTDVWLIATAPFAIEPVALEEVAKYITR
jgi:hypothetical protein